MTVSNSTADLYWVAPDSLQVSTPPTIFHYVLSNNLTNSTKTFNNPTTVNPLASCNYSFDLRDPFFTIFGSDGNGNTTMLDYNGAVEFTLFAVNGAGNGNAATFTLELQRRTPIVVVATVCAVLGTIIIVVLVIVIAVRYFMKKKKGTPNNTGNERAVNTTSDHANGCNESTAL
ncbi:hypothetical protein EMCRGX_G030264 [Ephydatia muelleri]